MPRGSPADRAATRSVSIALFTLLGGLALFGFFVMRKKLDFDNGSWPLIILPAMLIGHAWGFIEAVRAQRSQTNHPTLAAIGMTINGLLGAILLLLVTVIVILTGVWAGVGR
jgi:hypothetical protein